ncbi:hypothetical protein B0H10DRAFT_2426967 [Mycena sp. CBHHK59/15]|nr:hypothetical protein B0H10DRAFT_2426967 [Mycena sp. CBHHK59/15]
MLEPGDSAASHFFAIQELLLLVLDYISPPKATIQSSDRNSLAALARVSRNISGAALDALWRSIYQPGPLVRLLPNDAYEVSESLDGRVGEYRLKRPLEQSDFFAFDKYAPRIRFIEFSNSSKILERGCELLPYIKAFRDPILPALAEFHWEPSVGDGSICAFHLLSRQAFIPSDKLTLVMWSEIEHSNAESDVLADTINAFNDPALPWLPDVKTLFLRTIHYLPASRAITNLAHLESFSCDFPVESALLRKLAAIPHLRFLDLRSILGDVPADILPALSFPALDSLRLHGTQSSVQALLPLISSPVLFDVHLHPQDFQTTEPDLFALLLPPPGLYGLSPHVRTLELAAFAPLHVCRALQTFCVDVVMDELVFTDADVRAMARAWPALTLFFVTPRTRNLPLAPRVHLYTLWALVEGCPRLRLLRMAVDADVTDAFRVEDATGSCETMEELQLLYSPCGKPEIVAAFLNAAFPKLPANGFYASAPGHRPEDKAKWATVKRSLLDTA